MGRCLMDLRLSIVIRKVPRLGLRTRVGVGADSGDIDHAVLVLITAVLRLRVAESVGDMVIGFGLQFHLIIVNTRSLFVILILVKSSC